MDSSITDRATYLAQRDALIAEDRSLRRDYINAQARSEIEVKADNVIRKIRAQEAETIWNEELTSVPNIFPGMAFLTGKSIIMKTELFKLLCKMPKGALLHAHLDATVNAEFLFNLALEQPAMHICIHQPLTPSNVTSTLPQFTALPPDTFSVLSNLTEPAYTPGSWVPLQKARATFDSSLGGPEGFDRWIIGCMTINPAEAYGTHNTVAKIWQKFTSTFMVSTGLIRFEPIFSRYIHEFFMSSIEDGISYVEPRINFHSRYMVGADGIANIDHRQWVIMFERVMNEVKDEMKKQGREDEFIGAKIIYSTLKFISDEELEWAMEDCIALKKEFPHLIAGFDLVGNENLYRPLIDYLDPLLHFRQRQAEEGVDIPFILHAGETLGDGSMADMNMYDAVILGTKRIGHGFSLIKHPKLIEICRERGIALEVCPISNEILRLTSSMPMHPLPALLNNGVPVALCSDDPSVFGNMGLTYDFFQVLVGSEVTALSTLGSLARDSIEYSMMDSKEKEAARKAWERRWQKYCEYIVSY